MDKNVKNGILHIILFVLKMKNGLYICPNCVAEQTLDELLDGCDYCKTRFDISAYDDKVMSVMRNKSTFDTREGNTFATLIWIAVVVMGVSCAGTGLVLLLPTFGLSLIVLIIGIGIICLGIWGALKSVKNTEKNKCDIAPFVNSYQSIIKDAIMREMFILHKHLDNKYRSTTCNCNLE